MDNRDRRESQEQNERQEQQAALIRALLSGSFTGSAGQAAAAAGGAANNTTSGSDSGGGGGGDQGGPQSLLDQLRAVAAASATDASPPACAAAAATPAIVTSNDDAYSTLETALQALIATRQAEAASQQVEVVSLQSLLGLVTAASNTATGADTSADALASVAFSSIQSELVMLLIAQAQAHERERERERQRGRLEAVAAIQALLDPQQNQSSSTSSTSGGTHTVADSIISQLRQAQSSSSSSSIPQRQQPQQQQQQQQDISALFQSLSSSSGSGIQSQSQPASAAPENLMRALQDWSSRIASASPAATAAAADNEQQEQRQRNPGDWLLEQLHRQQQQTDIMVDGPLSMPTQVGSSFQAQQRQPAGSSSSTAAGLDMTAGKPTPGVQPYASAAPAVAVAVAGGEGSRQLIASRTDSSMDAIKSTDDFPPSRVLPGTKKAPQQRHESFPEKLYRLLMEVETKGRDDIISFTLEGDRFEIHQPDVFEEEVCALCDALPTMTFWHLLTPCPMRLFLEMQVIPLYYRHNKIGSFKRRK